MRQRIADVQSPPQRCRPNGHLSGPTPPQDAVYLPPIGGLLQRLNQDPRYPQGDHDHYPQGARVTDGLAPSCRQSPPLTMSGVPTTWQTTTTLDPVASPIARDTERYLERPRYGDEACLDSTPAAGVPSMAPLPCGVSRQPCAISSPGSQWPSSDSGAPAPSTYSYGEKQDSQYESTSALMASMQPTERRNLGQKTLHGKHSSSCLPPLYADKGSAEVLHDSNGDASPYCLFSYGVRKHILPSLFSEACLACLTSLPTWGTKAVAFNVKAIEFPESYYFVLDFEDQHPGCLEQNGQPIPFRVFAGDVWGEIEKRVVTQYWIRTPRAIAVPIMVM